METNPLRMEGYGGAVHVPELPCPSCTAARRFGQPERGLHRIPNNPLIAAAFGAVMAGGPHARSNKGGWRQRRDGSVVFERLGAAGGRIEIGFDDLSGDEAWREIATYSPLTLDTLATVLARLSDEECLPRTKHPHGSSAPVCSGLVRQAKAYNRYGDERRAFEWQVVDELARLLRLVARVDHYPGYDPDYGHWNREGVSLPAHPLLELDPDPPYDDTPAIDLAFGRWASVWLTAKGTLWVSPLPAEILKLDHRANRGADTMAKKIGLHLALTWGAYRKPAELTRRVDALLRSVGELQEVGLGGLTRGGRLFDRFEEAIMRLNESGLFEIAYEDGPFDPGQRVRGWVSNWMHRTLVFRRPAYLAPLAKRAPAVSA